MKNQLISLSILIFVICISPCTTFHVSNTPENGTARLKNSGSGAMSNSPVILKINGEYNKYCVGKLPWAYNSPLNCGFNVEFPAGKTTLEVTYKGTPTIKLEFEAEKDVTYNIDNDDGNPGCVKVYKKEGKNKVAVSECGMVITYNNDDYKDNSFNYATLIYDNKIRDCINFTLLKIDSIWGNKKAGLAWGYYYYPENTDIKLTPGKHIIEVIGGDARIPDTITIDFKANKLYTLDMEYTFKTISGCTGRLMLIETSKNEIEE